MDADWALTRYHYRILISMKLPPDIVTFLEGLVADVNSEWFEPGNEWSWRQGIECNAETAKELLEKYEHEGG